MNTNATELPPELLDILSDTAHYPDLEGTVARFEHARWTRSRLQLKLAESEINFQDSLRLKNKLDELEAYGSDETNPCRNDILPMLINCEYTLYKLNADTPLRQNPFLSHWVEVYQRWSSRLNKLYETDRACTSAEDANVWRHVHHSRLVLVKAILTESLHQLLKNPADLVDVRTHSSANSSSLQRTWWDPDPLDLSPFIKTLEEEGIYEPPTSPLEKETSNPAPPAPAPASTNSTTRTSASSDDIHPALQPSPAQAIYALTSQPVTLQSLETLNTLLTSGMLEKAGIDPTDVVRKYIQHGLRSLEGPPHVSHTEDLDGASYGGSSSDALLTPPGSSSGSSADRESRARTVRLLVLFIRSLIRKGLVGPEQLYYEIQEICVRFIWVREVREFRAFIEEGVE